MHHASCLIALAALHAAKVQQIFQLTIRFVDLTQSRTISVHYPLLQPQKDTGKGTCGPPDPHCPLSGYRTAARFIYEPVHELVEQQAQLCGGESGAIGAGLQEAQVVVDGRVGVTPLDMIDGVGAHVQDGRQLAVADGAALGHRLDAVAQETEGGGVEMDGFVVHNVLF